MKRIVMLVGLLAAIGSAFGQAPSGPSPDPSVVPDSRAARRARLRTAAEAAARARLRTSADNTSVEQRVSAPAAKSVYAAEATPAPAAESTAIPIRPSAPRPLRFYGYSSVGRGRLEYGFFHDGKRVYLAAVGDLIDERYSVVTIAPESAVVEDTYNRRVEVLLLSTAGPEGTSEAPGARNAGPITSSRSSRER